MSEQKSKDLKVSEAIGMLENMPHEDIVTFTEGDKRRTIIDKVNTLLEVKVDNTQVRKDRFVRVVEHRSNKVIDRLAILGKITQNQQNYLFSREQIENIFFNIKSYTSEIEKKFHDCLSVDETKLEYRINLQEEFVLEDEQDEV